MSHIAGGARDFVQTARTLSGGRLAMPEGPATAPASRREQDLADLIRKAQANPGVREVTEVYSRAQAALMQAQPYLLAVDRNIQWASDRTSA